MNIVKLQDSLKDFSDRQLMQTMQTGSAPQYLVLAEMQRRKKARENPAQKNRQSETSVAEDIMGGITQVPMGPMEMAEGGIVSFAKGGKTGRAKGEEEACYTNSRTGEKYCPPGTPQVEMPRTGQRKSFQEGGMIPPEEMAEMDRRLNAKNYFEENMQDILAANPNATVDDVYNAMYNPGQSGYEALNAPSPAASAATTRPAAPMPQPESLGSIEDSPVEEDQGLFGQMESGLTSLLRGIAPGDRGEETFEGTGELSSAAGGSPTSESAAGLSFITYQDEPLVKPIESVEEDQARRREQAEREQAAADESVTDEAAVQEDVFAPEPDPPEPPEQPETVEQDGLMGLIRDLQTERQELREGTRERAINEALIRGGLAMAASDDPNFLSAAAEGGIGGLAGYQSAMERAAERQGEISSDVVDLSIARETAALKQRAAQAAIENRISDEETARINSLIELRASLQDDLASFTGTEEERKALQDQIKRISSGIPYLNTSGGTTGPANTGNVKIDGE